MPPVTTPRRKTSVRTRSNPGDKIPKDIREAIQDILDGLRELCDGDEKLVLKVLYEIESKKVDKIFEDANGEIDWFLGNLRAVEDIYKVKPAKLVEMFPASEEDPESDEDDADEDDAESEDEDDEDEDFVPDEDADDEDAPPRRKRKAGAK